VTPRPSSKIENAPFARIRSCLIVGPSTGRSPRTCCYVNHSSNANRANAQWSAPIRSSWRIKHKHGMLLGLIPVSNLSKANRKTRIPDYIPLLSKYNSLHLLLNPSPQPHTHTLPSSSLPGVQRQPQESKQNLISVTTMYEPASSRLPSEIWELILFQSISSQYLDPVCPSSKFWEFLQNTKSRDEFDRAERHRLRLRCVCSMWRRILDAENHRLICTRHGSVEHQTKYSTETIRRARKVEKVSHLSGFLQQTTRWEILCSTAFSDPSDLDTLARNIHLHPRLRCLIFQTRHENQNPLSPQLTIALLSNITFLSIRTNKDRPTVLHFEGVPVSLPVLQNLIWCTWYNAEHPFPVETLELPSLHHLSLITDPTCNRVLEIGEKYSNLISFHFLAAIDACAPVRFPPLNHFPRLQELMLNKRFDSNALTLLPTDHPLERLYLHQISIKWLLELIPKLLEANPKHLRLISVDQMWFSSIRKAIGKISLSSLKALAAEVEVRHICLIDCQNSDLPVVLKEREDELTKMEGLSSLTEYEGSPARPSTEEKVCGGVLYSHINEIYPFW